MSKQGLNTDNKSEFLFKNFLELPTNKPGLEFFNENQIAFSDRTKAETIYLQNIPEDPVFDASLALGKERYPDLSFSNYFTNETDTLEKFEDLVLEEVPETGGKSFQAITTQDGDKISILRDAIQYNYGKDNKFNYILKRADGTTIELNDKRYNYIFDIKVGYIVFFKDGELEGVSSIEPPTLTFVRYRGLKGLDFGDINLDVSLNKALTVKGKATFEDSIHIKKNLLVDGSQVNIHTEHLDICDNIIQLNKGLNELLRSDYGNITSGFEINRGSIMEDGSKVPLPLYNIHYIYDEERKRENKQFEYITVGISGEEQPIALRKLDISAGTLAFWNDKNYEYDFCANLVVDLSGEKGVKLGIGVDDPSYNLHISGDGFISDNVDIGGKLNIQVELDESDAREYTLNDYMRLMFEQPPPFETISGEASQVAMDISWVKGGLYDEPRYVSFVNKELPDISDIVIKIQQYDTSNGDTLEREIFRISTADSTSSTFNINQTYNNQLPSFGGTDRLTFQQVKYYKFELFARNTNTLDDTYYKINTGTTLFQFELVNPPSKPRDVSFVSIDATTIQLTLTRPEFSDRREELNEADIADYRVVYQPVPLDASSLRLTYDDVSTDEISYIETKGNAQDISINIDTTQEDISNLLPLTVYRINGVSATNNVNSDFGDENTDISSVLKQSGFDYSNFKDVAPFAAKFKDKPNTFYNPESSSIVTGNYFNYEKDKSLDIGFEIGFSKIYVNRTNSVQTLGKNSIGGENLVTVSVEWRKKTSETSEFTTDSTIEFNGFDEDGTFLAPNKETEKYFKVFAGILEANENEGPIEYNKFGIAADFLISTSYDIISKDDLSASQFPYQIRYEISGGEIDGNTVLPDGSNALLYSPIYEFYVDDLAGTPVIENINAQLTPSQHLYTYGIPSIQTLSLDISYNLRNIGSQFLPSDRIVSTIDISNIFSSSPPKEIKSVTTDDISVNETFSDIHFTRDINNTEIQSAFQLTAVNLNGTITETVNTINNNLHYDSKILEEDLPFTPYKWDGTLGDIPEERTVIHSTPFTLSENEMIYYSGKFYIEGTTGIPPFVDWREYSPYDEESQDYSGVASGEKWVVRKEEISILNDDERYRVNVSTTGTVSYNIFTMYENSSQNIITPWLSADIDLIVDEQQNPFLTNLRDTDNLGNRRDYVEGGIPQNGLYYYPTGNENTANIYIRVMATGMGQITDIKLEKIFG